ncbi:hypothetical protein BHE74_00034207 [Ensete ventricosum]|nr:hypothetical protein BHE74_00034207 [Ensete ventricosum]
MAEGKVSKQRSAEDTTTTRFLRTSIRHLVAEEAGDLRTQLLLLEVDEGSDNSDDYDAYEYEDFKDNWSPAQLLFTLDCAEDEKKHIGGEETLPQRVDNFNRLVNLARDSPMMDEVAAVVRDELQRKQASSVLVEWERSSDRRSRGRSALFYRTVVGDTGERW